MKLHAIKSWILLLAAAAMFTGCGSKPADPPPPPPPSTTVSSPPAKIIMSTDLVSINTDGSNTATLTATVLDAGNAAVEGATILFSTTGGTLGASSVITDATGTAIVTLNAGTVKTNQIATITATAEIDPTVRGQIPIDIQGTWVSMTPVTTNITVGNTDTLTVTVKDAANVPVYNMPVTVTVSGAATVTQSWPTTDVTGQVTVTVTGTAAGTATVTANGGGATASQAYTVNTAVNTFAITSPIGNVYLAAGSVVDIFVNAPGTANVQFAASLGTWVSSGSGVATIPVVGGVAHAQFTSATAGTSNIQIQDAANPATVTSMSAFVFQPSSAATQISIQASTNVLAPSTGGTSNTSTIIAQVRDGTGQAVGNAPVYFSVPNPTGGGETIYPVVVYTDASGLAQTTFTSGSISSGSQGVDIYAQVISPAIGPVATNVVIGGTAGSVVIGRASVAVELSPTTYALPMSVLVADSNGNPAANALVTLNAWPSYFHFGYWVGDSAGNNCGSHYLYGNGAVAVPNEDINENLILDPGEDVIYTVQDFTTDQYGNPVVLTYTPNANDATLTPLNSAAGNVPTTVTTDASGVANFDLIYLKNSGAWVTDRISASTLVLGTETRTSIEFTLPVLKADADKCILPNSPFNMPQW